jgi:hemerythrin
MEWKEEFSVGIPEIDEQHQTLTGCITLIEEGITNQAPLWAVDLALVRLQDYVRIHFAVEESLMRIHRYPELQQHVREHLQFADELKKLQEKSLRVDISRETTAFLEAWLHEHIMTSDKHYAEYLPKARVATVVPIRPARD